MNATKHTPGPWRFAGLLVKAENLEIAKVNIDLRDFSGPTPQDISAQYANARLISAAPELLAALEVVQAWLPDAARIPGVATIASRVNAAIAKARGE